MRKRIRLTEREIRRLVANIVETLHDKKKRWRGYYNFEKYQTEDDMELYEYLCLDKIRTNLPMRIFVDDGGAYKRHGHPLWLYICNGYSSESPVLPVLISRSPSIPLARYHLNVSEQDLRKVFRFIRENYDLIWDLANDKIVNTEFKKTMKPLTESFGRNRMSINEMSKLTTDITKLPVDIWVDEIESFRKSGHYKRIKFPARKDVKTSRGYSSLSITDEPQCFNIPPKNDLTNATIQALKNFVKKYKFELSNLTSDENFQQTGKGITLDEFKIILNGGKLGREPIPLDFLGCASPALPKTRP